MDVMRSNKFSADMEAAASFVDARTKGLPHATMGIQLSEVGGKNWNLLAEDLPLPVAILRHSALANNRRWMLEFVARTGVKLAPHGKTSMSPELFSMQLTDGAWAITLSTVQQVRVARHAGINRILLANEVVGPRDIDYILAELKNDPFFEFHCLVDSLPGVSRLADAATARSIGRPLQLLIEMGYMGGRAGCRDVESALAVARAIKAGEPHLMLCGIEGFEGLHQYGPASESVANVHRLLAQIVEVAHTADDEGLFDGDEIILSAGGSAYYDIVAEVFAAAHLRRKTSIVLRSGCYLTHDAGIYERLFGDVLERSSDARAIGARFENALEVWAYVISVPESGRAILGAGRRDFGHDIGVPTPLMKVRPGKSQGPESISIGHEIVAINDQHAHMTFPARADIQVGDMISLGVSHPCTTFDKWQLIYIVDDNYNVLFGVRTYF
jgi:D-serine dehydratase